MKVSTKDSFSSCDQIHNFLRIRSDLLKKFLKKTSFCVVLVAMGLSLFSNSIGCMKDVISDKNI